MQMQSSPQFSASQPCPHASSVWSTLSQLPPWLSEPSTHVEPASSQNSWHVEKAEFSTTTMQTSLSATLVPDELQVCDEMVSHETPPQRVTTRGASTSSSFMSRESAVQRDLGSCFALV